MRALAAFLGVAVLAAVWLGPLPRTFSGHMTMHMGVVAVAAPLLALAAGGASLRFSPILASLIELVVVWGWHTPALHAAARHDTVAFVVEQGSFLLSGLLVWVTSLARGGERTAAGIVALLLTSMHMTLLGALIALATRPLFAHHGALDDQHLGGAIMLLAGGLAYLAGGLGLTARLVRARVARSPA